MQELENENDKLKREVQRLMKAIAETTDFGNNGGQVSPAAKEFLGERWMNSDPIVIPVQNPTFFLISWPDVTFILNSHSWESSLWCSECVGMISVCLWVVGRLVCYLRVGVRGQK